MSSRFGGYWSQKAPVPYSSPLDSTALSAVRAHPPIRLLLPPSSPLHRRGSLALRRVSLALRLSGIAVRRLLLLAFELLVLVPDALEFSLERLFFSVGESKEKDKLDQNRWDGAGGGRGGGREGGGDIPLRRSSNSPS